MGLAQWVELLQLVLRFPEEIMKLARLVRDTPGEKRAELTERIEREARDLAQTGRPQWD